MAEYLGFIAGIDENVGRLLAVLDDPNFDGNRQDSILENTLILFTSDNGGTHTDNLPLRGEKGMFTEGGIRVSINCVLERSSSGRPDKSTNGACC